MFFLAVEGYAYGMQALATPTAGSKQWTTDLTITSDLPNGDLELAKDEGVTIRPDA